MFITVGCSDDVSGMCYEDRSRQFTIATAFRFDNSFAAHYHRFGTYSVERDILTVHSVEEAVDFDRETTIVVWPSILSKGIIDAINQHVNRFDFDLEAFSLTYPLTVDDLVDNGAEMLELIFELGGTNFTSFQRYANSKYGDEYWQNLMAMYWLKPGRLEALNEFLEGQDLSELGLTWPITEADVHEDSWRFNYLGRAFLTSEQSSYLHEMWN